MKTILFTLLALAGALYTQARESVSLMDGWIFTPEGGEPVSVCLPHDFQISQPWVAPEAGDTGDASNTAANIKSRLSSRAFKEMGRGEYRLKLTPADSLEGKRLLLDFGGLLLRGDVSLNGKHIGGTDYGYLGFEIDVTGKLIPGQENEIVVTADTGEPNNSRWYTGAGLYRDVKLAWTPKDLYFNRHPLHIVTPVIGPDSATVALTADLNIAKPHKEAMVEIEVVDPDGRVATSSTRHIDVLPRWRNRPYPLDTLTVGAPRLWDVDDPQLYTMRVTLRRADGSVADRAESAFGFRTVEFSPEFGCKLNGRKVLLKGIGNHHTLGALGAAAYPRAIEKRLKLLKEFGFNHIRTSHNPYSEEFLDLCDRYGFIVVDELYDKWLTQYAGGRTPFSERWQQDIPEWVKRDRNHPSIVMWSLGNELQGFSNMQFNDWGVTLYHLQRTLLRRYDQTRPVTVAMHPRYRSLETDSVPAPLVFETDIAAYNYRYMYFPGDSRRWPHLIFYQSEANLTMMGPNFFEPDNDKVVGLAYWGMIDYLGESLGWPAKGWTNGVFDISLRPKSNAWMVRSMFRDEPTVRIGVVGRKAAMEWNDVQMATEFLTDHWNFTPGDTLTLHTYTNADSVALRLNGRTLGCHPNSADPKKRNRIVWSGVIFEPGTLEAVAYRDGLPCATHRLETASRAKRLVAKADLSDGEWKADGLDLIHIAVEAVDSKGRRSPLASDKLRFSVEGPARIVGVDNGDMTSAELHSPAPGGLSAERSLHQGTALVILRSEPGSEAGPVTLRIDSDAYPTTRVKMHTR